MWKRSCDSWKILPSPTPTLNSWVWGIITSAPGSDKCSPHDSRKCSSGSEIFEPQPMVQFFSSPGVSRPSGQLCGNRPVVSYVPIARLHGAFSHYVFNFTSRFLRMILCSNDFSDSETIVVFSLLLAQCAWDTCCYNIVLNWILSKTETRGLSISFNIFATHFNLESFSSNSDHLFSL